MVASGSTRKLQKLQLVGAISLLKNTVFAEINLTQITSFLSYLISNYRPQYRKVRKDPTWQDYYKVADVDFPVLDDYRNIDTDTDDGYPCRECQIVLPLKLVTVDHQGPQTGGGLRAIVRVFRSVGLTEEGPVGNKGKALNNLHAMNVGGNVGAGNIGTDDAQRYDLNNVGMIYWSVIHKCKLVDTFAAYCMNNIANLRPLCLPCNASLGNAKKDIYDD